MLVEVEVPATGETLAALLEGLVELNLVLMQRSALPPLYRSGVRYQEEDGTERWQTCEQTYKRKRGDCEDLCAWRVAELRRAGYDAEAIARRTRSRRRRLWHVLVLHADGQIEDPSRVLGMGRKRRAR